MKKLISIALILTLVLALVPAAFADHTHEFGEWFTFLSPTETKPGISRRYCTVKGCKVYEDLEIAVLPQAYISETRDIEKHRSAAITGAIVGDDVSLHDWTCSQMVDKLALLTDRYFNQAVQVKYEGLGIGSFTEEKEHSVSLTAAQLERLMAAREGLALQLTTASASVVIDAETLASLKAEKSVALTTVREADALTVKLLVDSKSVALPVTVLTWCKDEGKYVGDESSELVWGRNGNDYYMLAYTAINSGSTLQHCEYDAEPEEPTMLNYTANWKLRLGDLFTR